MAGEKPKYRVVAKSKSSGNYQALMAFWENENGTSGIIDAEVAEIRLKNGATLTTGKDGNCYLNLYVNEPTTTAKTATAEPVAKPASENVGDDVPF